MNKDYRVSIAFRNSVKRRRLIRALGKGAVVALYDLWGFTALQYPKGKLGDLSADDIEEAVDWDGARGAFVATLIELHLLDVDEDGAYHVHEWKEHNGFAYHAEERSQKASRASDVRWKGENITNATSIANGMPGAMPKHDVSNAPSPSPNPSPTPSPKASLLAPSHAHEVLTVTKGNETPPPDETAPYQTAGKADEIPPVSVPSSPTTMAPSCPSDGPSSKEDFPDHAPAHLPRKEILSKEQSERLFKAAMGTMYGATGLIPAVEKALKDAARRGKTDLYRVGVWNMLPLEERISDIEGGMAKCRKKNISGDAQVPYCIQTFPGVFPDGERLANPGAIGHNQPSRNGDMVKPDDEDLGFNF